MNISDLEDKLKRSSPMIASNFNPDFRFRNAVSVPRQLSRTSDMMIVLINNEIPSDLTFSADQGRKIFCS